MLVNYILEHLVGAVSTPASPASIHSETLFFPNNFFVYFFLMSKAMHKILNLCYHFLSVLHLMWKVTI